MWRVDYSILRGCGQFGVEGRSFHIKGVWTIGVEGKSFYIKRVWTSVFFTNTTRIIFY